MSEVPLHSPPAFNPTTLQPFNPKHPNPTTLQPCNPPALQFHNPNTLQPYNFPSTPAQRESVLTTARRCHACNPIKVTSGGDLEKKLFAFYT